MNKAVKSPFIILTSFLVIGFALYSPSINAFFLADDFEKMLHYSSNDFIFFLGHYFVPYNDIRPIANFIQFNIFQIFETTASLHHIHNIIIHCINGFLLIYISKKLFTATKNIFMPISIGLLFLVLPYQTEAVSWIDGFSDLYATLFGLLSLYCFLTYLQTKSNQSIALSLVFFTTGIFTKESIFILPLIVAAIAYYKKANPLKHFLTFLSILMLAIAIRYFLYEGIVSVNNNTLQEFEPGLYFTNYLFYLAKFFAFYRYLPLEIKSILKLIIEFKWIWMAIIFTSGFFLRKKLITQYHKVDLTVVGFVFFLFTISLLPVLNLETTFLGDSQSDRYGYFPSVFVCMIWALLINAQILNWKLSQLIYVVFLLLMGIWTYQTNRNWKIAGEVARNLVIDQSHKLLGNTENIILNLPDNYKGAFILRNGYEEGIKLFNNVEPKCYVIATISLFNVNDKIKITQINKKTIRVAPVSAKSYLLYLHNNINKLPSSIKLLKHDRNHFILEKTTEEKLKLFYYSDQELKSMII